MAKRAKQLALCGALAATGALSLGSAHALAIPPDSTLPQSCHGSVVSNFVHEVGGTGDFYPANPGPSATTSESSSRSARPSSDEPGSSRDSRKEAVDD